MNNSKGLGSGRFMRRGAALLRSPAATRNAAVPVAAAKRWTAFAPGAAMTTEAAFLLLLPILSFFCVNFQPVLQNGTLDPFFYTSYVHNFHDLWLRYGVTYYGVRFGFILPARLCTTLFGPIAGYFALRYVLALVFAAPLYAVCKRYLSLPVAVFVYATAVSTPYLAHTLLWDQPDATGCPFLSAAICLFLLGRGRATLASSIAGICLGIAGNSNVFTLGIFGIFLAIYGVLWRLFRGDWSLLLRRVLVAAAGALAVTAAGSLYYWRATGVWNIFSVTIGVASSLSHGGMRQWRTGGWAWTLGSYQVYVPVWLSLCCAPALAAGKRSFRVAVAGGFGIAVTLFYYVHQFLLGADTLQLFYYFSYAAGAIYFMMAIVYQRLWTAARLGAAGFVCVACAATILPWLLLSFGWDPLAPKSLAVFASLAACAMAVWAALLYARHIRTRPVLARAAVVLFGLGYSAGFATYGSTVHRRADPSHLEVDVYRVALQFIREMPKYQDSGPVLFWYNNRAGNLINSVQSTYLWGYSRLNGVAAGDPGMPALNAGQIGRLKQARCLALLGESQQELTQGIASLSSHGVAWRRAKPRVIASGGYTLYWELVELGEP